MESRRSRRSDVHWLQKAVVSIHPSTWSQQRISRAERRATSSKCREAKQSKGHGWAGGGHNCSDLDSPEGRDVKQAQTNAGRCRRLRRRPLERRSRNRPGQGGPSPNTGWVEARGSCQRVEDGIDLGRRRLVVPLGRVRGRGRGRGQDRAKLDLGGRVWMAGRWSVGRTGEDPVQSWQGRGSSSQEIDQTARCGLYSGSLVRPGRE